MTVDARKQTKVTHTTDKRSPQTTENSEIMIRLGTHEGQGTRDEGQGRTRKMEQTIMHNYETTSLR